MALNPAKIQEIKNLDEDGSDSVLKELIETFLRTSPSKVKKMIESFYLKDFPALKTEAHSLRSSSLTLGADELSQIALSIEYAKDISNLEEYLHEQILKLHKEFEQVKSELTKYL